MRSKLTAAVLIVLTFLGTNGSWHVSGDDPDCDPRVLAHDHSAHREWLRAPSPAGNPAHCAICHWLQTFRSDTLRPAGVPFSHLAYTRRPLAAAGDLHAIVLLDISPRGPPA